MDDLYLNSMKKSASMLVNPTAYFNGYKFGILGKPYPNPYDIISSASKHEDWQDGFNEGMREFNKGGNSISGNIHNEN